MKKIEKGKFYYLHDGSKTGHPCFVIEADELNNRYLVIRFDSDKVGEIPKYKRGVRHITKLNFPTDKGVVNSYVKNRPMLCKRKDFGDIDLSFMKINQKDKNIIDDVLKRKYELSPSLKNKK